MPKKAQVTIFVIISIVIIIGLAVLFYYKEDLAENLSIKIFTKQATLPYELQNTESMIDGCVKSLVTSGLHLLGVQGGYLELPEDVLETENMEVAYAYDKGIEALPEKEMMEQQLGNYVNLALPACVDFSKFPKFSMIAGNPETKVEINEESVKVTLSYRVTAKNEESSYRLKGSYTQTVPVKLGRMYDVAKAFVEKEVKDPSMIPLSDLENSGFVFEVKPYTKDLLIYSLTDDSLEESYTFMFATRF